MGTRTLAVLITIAFSVIGLIGDYVLCSVSLVLLLTAIGMVLFRESLNYFDVIGMVLAVSSLVLSMRFA